MRISAQVLFTLGLLSALTIAACSNGSSPVSPVIHHQGVQSQATAKPPIVILPTAFPLPT